MNYMYLECGLPLNLKPMVHHPPKTNEIKLLFPTDNQNISNRCEGHLPQL